MTWRKATTVPERYASSPRQRGAVLVESLIVISCLILGLMGVMYFKNFYVKQLTAHRLAQASVIAYSMGACQNNVPSEWIGAGDRGKLTVAGPSERREDAVDRTQPNNTSANSSDPQAQQIVNGAGQLSTGGDGVLNPMVSSRVAGRVAIEARDPNSLTRARHRVFDGKVGALTHVSCGEKVREGEYSDVLDMVKSAVGGLIGR